MSGVQVASSTLVHDADKTQQVTEKRKEAADLFCLRLEERVATSYYLLKKSILYQGGGMRRSHFAAPSFCVIQRGKRAPPGKAVLSRAYFMKKS